MGELCTPSGRRPVAYTRVFALFKISRNRKIKGGAFGHRTFGPDESAMALDNTLHNRQANAGAREFFFTV